MITCPFCQAPRGSAEQPCCEKMGRLQDGLKGPKVGMGKRPTPGPDLVLRGVRNDALRRAIDKTGR